MCKFILSILLLVYSSYSFAQKHILVLQSYDMAYYWASSLQEGISKAFSELPNGYEVHIEFMDTHHYKSPEYFAKLADWYEKKYSNVKFEIVLTADDDAFNFYKKYFDRLFPDSALFFCGKGTFDEEFLKIHPRPVRGVMEFIDMLDTLKIAGKVHHTHKAYFVIDNTTTGNVQHAKWMASFKKNAPEFEVESLQTDKYSFDELLEKIKTLKDGFILLNVIGQDRIGEVADNLQMTKKIVEASNIPVYVESSMRVGLGVVGGRVTDGERHGFFTAQKLVNYLKGNDTGPYVDYENKNQLLFDYTPLVRFGIDPDDLPAESIILNRPESIYDEYKVYIWTVIIIVSVLMLVILIQSLRMRSRRQFQLKLQELVTQRTQELNKQIEEQKKLRRTLISREKLASLGNLTAGIAHEIKNPLNIIINSAQVIDNRCKQLPEQEIKPVLDVRRMTQLIIKNSFRADSIIQNMLGQARTAEAPVVDVNINQLLDEASALVFHASKSKYDINISILKTYGEIPNIQLSKDNVLRAFINILENSFYALNEKSKITEDYKPTLKLSSSLINDKVLIEIIDNGTGIPEEILDKILNPFFTTKPAGEGTGLGLSMVNDIISSNRGELDIVTKAGEFTHLKITFPIK